jgi:L-fuculose-phosphate aldolase
MPGRILSRRWDAGGGPRGRRCVIFQQCRDIGRDLFLAGLVGSHSGNLSFRRGAHLVVTRRGAMLGDLRPRDLVVTGIECDDDAESLASTELPTHRAIYRRTNAKAILHTHPPHGVVLSFDQLEIVPVDAEGSHLFDRIPVVVAERAVGSEEMAEVISGALIDHEVCMLRGHGLFAAGRSLEEVYRLTSAFEAAARIGYLARLARIDPGWQPARAAAPDVLTES